MLFVGRTLSKLCRNTLTGYIPGNGLLLLGYEIESVYLIQFNLNLHEHLLGYAYI